MPYKLTDEQIEKILSMTELRCTQEEIAKAAGCSKPTVHRIQRLHDLPASNRHGDKGNGHSAIPPVFEEHRNEEPERKPGEWIIAAEKIIKFVGIKTGLKYTVGLKSDSVIVDPGHFEVNLKDLVAFGNELIDVAETVEWMRGSCGINEQSL